MNKISLRQQRIIVVYAWGHCLLGIICAAVAVVGPWQETGPGFSITAWLTCYFFGPYILLDKIGITLPSLKYLDYLYLYLAGLLYGYVYMLVYKLVRRR
ncbi:MAG: hypothetical protein K8I00_03005 [Candidatus Omnitrophica bacterium]|nr:hypothetical protein [Candidatus Omnitrophota bacterium]